MESDDNPRSKGRYNITQLDCFATLGGRQEEDKGAREEDKADLLGALPFVEYMEDAQPLRLATLFRDEDMYLGEASDPSLDSRTLPMLFGRSNSRGPANSSQSRGSEQHPDVGDTGERIASVLTDRGRLIALAERVCHEVGLFADQPIEVSESSPIAFLVDRSQAVTAKGAVLGALDFVLRGIQSAVTAGAHGDKAESEVSQTASMMCEGETKRRRPWTKEEEAGLMDAIKPFGEVRRVPEDVWMRLASEFSRTTCSIHAKAKSMLKRPRREEGAKPERKPEAATTYVEMITGTLSALPGQRASKDEILAGMATRYGVRKEEVERGVLQCLSRRFVRFPGVYRLAPNVVPQDRARPSVKERLIYILGRVAPNGEASLSQIKEMYRTEFGEELDMKQSAESNQAVWEKTISKTLLKSPEFDKSSAKTLYGLQPPTSPR